MNASSAAFKRLHSKVAIQAAEFPERVFYPPPPCGRFCPSQATARQRALHHELVAALRALCGKPSAMPFDEVLFACQVHYGIEGDEDDGDGTRFFFAHAATGNAASGNIRCRYNFIHLEAEEGEVGQITEGLALRYRYAPHVPTSRPLPCARGCPASGALDHVTMSDFVAVLVEPTVAGSVTRVRCRRLRCSLRGGDRFRVEGILEEAREVANDLEEPPGDDGDSDLDWFGAISAVAMEPGVAPEPDIGDELVELFAPDREFADAVQNMLEDAADDEGTDGEEEDEKEDEAPPEPDIPHVQADPEPECRRPCA